MGGGGGGAEKIMCAHAHYESETRCSLKGGHTFTNFMANCNDFVIF